MAYTAPLITLSDSGDAFNEGTVYTLTTNVTYAAGETDPVTGLTVNWGELLKRGNFGFVSWISSFGFRILPHEYTLDGFRIHADNSYLLDETPEAR